MSAFDPKRTFELLPLLTNINPIFAALTNIITLWMKWYL